MKVRLTDIAVILGQGLDGVSTLRFLHNGSGCTEGNVWFGTHPHDSTIILAKVAVILLNMFTVRVFTGSTTITVMAYVTALLGAVAGINNFLLCGW